MIQGSGLERHLRRGECIMLGMPEFPSSSLRILSRSCCESRGEREREKGGGAGETPLVQNLRKFVTPSRNTRARGRGNCKVSYGTFAPRVMPQRGCFPLALPVVCYAKMLTATHSSVQVHAVDFCISVSLVFFWALSHTVIR